MRNDLDLAYYAGLFDGEGSVGALTSRIRKTNSVQMATGIELANTHRGIVDELCAVFGGNVLESKGERYGNNYIWKWRATGTNAENFLRAIEPYSRIKRDEILVFLRIRETIVPSGERVDWELRLELIAELNRTRNSYRVPRPKIEAA